MAYRSKERKDPEAVRRAFEAAAKYDEDLQETIDAEEIDRVADEYIKQCFEEGRRPTLEGLGNKLGVTSDVVKRWLKPAKDERDTHKAQRIAAKKAMDRMTDQLQQCKDPVSIFLLKQPHYGGYTDKQEEAKNGDTAHIKVSFCGRKG